jgi:hypothetical protein
VERRVFLLRKRSWRSVHIVSVMLDLGVLMGRYWSRFRRMSSLSLREEVGDRAICSRISWGRCLAAEEVEEMHLPVDARPHRMQYGSITYTVRKWYTVMQSCTYHFIHFI